MPRMVKHLIGGLLLGGLILLPLLTLTLQAQQTAQNQAVRYYLCGACMGTGKVKVWQVDPCPQCGGDGRQDVQCQRCSGVGSWTTTCNRCGGDGVRWVVRRWGPDHGVLERVQVICSTCNGTGIRTRTCSTCGGDGQIEITCRACQGRGQYGYWAWRPCAYCRGTGYYAYVPVVDSHRE